MFHAGRDHPSWSVSRISGLNLFVGGIRYALETRDSYDKIINMAPGDMVIESTWDKVTETKMDRMSLYPCIPPVYEGYEEYEIDDQCLNDDPCIQEKIETIGNSIHTTLRNGGRVLVHCFAGVSRSPTAIIYYLWKYCGYSLETSTREVIRCRPCTSVSAGLRDLLSNWSERKETMIIEYDVEKVPQFSRLADFVDSSENWEMSPWRSGKYAMVDFGGYFDPRSFDAEPHKRLLLPDHCKLRTVLMNCQHDFHIICFLNNVCPELVGFLTTVRRALILVNNYDTIAPLLFLTVCRVQLLKESLEKSVSENRVLLRSDHCDGILRPFVEQKLKRLLTLGGFVHHKDEDIPRIRHHNLNLVNSDNLGTGHQIVDNLWLGGIYFAQESYAKYRYGYVVNLAEIDMPLQITDYYKTQDSEHVRLHLSLYAVPDLDDSADYMDKLLDIEADKIHWYLQRGQRVLVHCIAGVSRSPTLVIYYLMKYHHRNLDDAMEFVREKRHTIYPNEGFLQLLRSRDRVFKKEAW